MARTGGQISQSEHNQHRLQRALSWFERSEKARADEEKFIFLWISFNASYGSEPTGMDEDQLTENRKIRNFLHEIIKRDAHQKIGTILLEKHSEPLRVFLENPYVFRLFWRWARDPSSAYNWRKRFESNRDRIQNALEQKNAHTVFFEVFKRLYELRNQVFHGGVAFAKGWGHTQLRNGTNIMADVVPVILDIMKADIEANPDSEIWGKVAYPRVGDNPD
ncbi:MAG: HEPN domain-containing protein [Nitrospinae bacterium]|nr:HEPN domain-containing protein [Nitrospinota bacterium]